MRLRGLRVSSALGKFGAQYQAVKVQNNLVDFDYPVVYTAELFVGQGYGKGVRYGDPYLWSTILRYESGAIQDCQVAVPHVKTVGVFADDDQAIFESRVQKQRTSNGFIAELKAKEYPLSVNYRCAEKIVKLGNLLIKSDPCSSGRQTEPYKAGGRCGTFDPQPKLKRKQ